MVASDKPWRFRFPGFLLGVGDFVFLVAVGVVATLSMDRVHRLGWNLAFALIGGMVLAMIVQTALALAVSPILGYRESMLPSMVVAMVGPMAVCVLDVMNVYTAWHQLAFLGVALGAGAHLIARRCGCYRARACSQQ